MRRTARFSVGGGAAVLGLALAVSLPGCGAAADDGYDPALRFPPRADVLVISLPPREPAGFAPAGKLDESIANLGAIGGVLLDPAKLPPVEQGELTRALEDTFGTPAAPRVPANAMGLTAESLAAGAKSFKARCATCHGLAGDGRGPNREWVNPPPRDFRQGQFKFVSSPSGRPRDTDFVNVIRNGITNAGMPAFSLLSDDELYSLAGYTMYLSLRGRVEFEAIAGLLGPDGLDEPLSAFAQRRFVQVAAKQTIPVYSPKPEPEPTPERIRAGFAAYAANGCGSCHADYGRTPAYRYDTTGVPARVPDLTAGVFRGGATNEDVYRRLVCGIPAAGMPALPEAVPQATAWDLVLFLKALPVPTQLPADVRAVVYPGVK